MAWASRMADSPVPFHTMVSHVPGPHTPMFLGEAELLVPVGLGPVRDNMGLFHIVSSSEQMMSLSFSACRALLPDGQYYERCLHSAFTALQRTALGGPGSLADLYRELTHGPLPVGVALIVCARQHQQQHAAHHTEYQQDQHGG